MLAATIDIQPSAAEQAFREFISSERMSVRWVYNCNNSNSASGIFDLYSITNSLKGARTSDVVDEVSSVDDKSTENADMVKRESDIAIKVLKNSKLATDAAKKAFGIDINHEVSADGLAKDILCVTHALRNIDAMDLMLTKPAKDEIDFFYAFSDSRVMKLQSSFPRQQDDEVIVSFYKMGDLLYMNNMPLKNLVNDLENYL